MLSPTRRICLAAIALSLSTCTPLSVDEIELPRSHIATVVEGIAEQLEGTAEAEDACPADMVRVAGNYCPDVEQKCLRWLDPPGKYHAFRCAEYARDPVCRAARTPMHFCIDRDEQRLPHDHDARPTNNVSYADAAIACNARGARLCTQSEWQFACEGEDMRPYPYGFIRDSNACNVDHFELGHPGQGLHDLRTPTGANPGCKSPFGVLDLAGNLEEWVSRDPGAGGNPTLLKGSWWMPGRSTCRATNAGHNAVYHGKETGFRCCR